MKIKKLKRNNFNDVLFSFIQISEVQIRFDDFSNLQFKNKLKFFFFKLLLLLFCFKKSHRIKERERSYRKIMTQEEHLEISHQQQFPNNDDSRILSKNSKNIGVSTSNNKQELKNNNSENLIKNSPSITNPINTSLFDSSDRLPIALALNVADNKNQSMMIVNTTAVSDMTLLTDQNKNTNTTTNEIKDSFTPSNKPNDNNHQYEVTVHDHQKKNQINKNKSLLSGTPLRISDESDQIDKNSAREVLKSDCISEEDPLARLKALKASISNALKEVKEVLVQHGEPSINETVKDQQEKESIQKDEQQRDSGGGAINFRFVKKIRRRSTFEEDGIKETEFVINQIVPAADQSESENLKNIHSEQNNFNEKNKTVLNQVNKNSEKLIKSEEVSPVANDKIPIDISETDNNKIVKSEDKKELKEPVTGIKVKTDKLNSSSVTTGRRGSDIVLNKVPSNKSILDQRRASTSLIYTKNKQFPLTSDNNLSTITELSSVQNKTQLSKAKETEKKSTSKTSKTPEIKTDETLARKSFDKDNKEKENMPPAAVNQVATDVVIINDHQIPAPSPNSLPNQKLESLDPQIQKSLIPKDSLQNVKTKTEGSKQQQTASKPNPPLESPLAKSKTIHPQKKILLKPKTDKENFNEKESSSPEKLALILKSSLIRLNPIMRSNACVPNQMAVRTIFIPVQQKASVVEEQDEEYSNTLVKDQCRGKKVKTKSLVHPKSKPKRKVLIKRIKRKLSFETEEPELVVEEKEIEPLPQDEKINEEEKPPKKKSCLKIQGYQSGETVLYLDRIKRNISKWKRATVVEPITSISYKLKLEGEEKAAHVSYMKKFTDKKVQFGGKEYLEVDYARDESSTEEDDEEETEEEEEQEEEEGKEKKRKEVYNIWARV